jgi:hypothetical protein
MVTKISWGQELYFCAKAKEMFSKIICSLDVLNLFLAMKKGLVSVNKSYNRNVRFLQTTAAISQKQYIPIP